MGGDHARYLKRGQSSIVAQLNTQTCNILYAYLTTSANLAYLTTCCGFGCTIAIYRTRLNFEVLQTYSCTDIYFLP